MDFYPVTFSPRRSQNKARASGDEALCYVCGTGVPRPVHWVRISDGGSVFATAEYAERPENLAGDLGCYPLGPECYRRLPADVRRALVTTKLRRFRHE